MITLPDFVSNPNIEVYTSDNYTVLDFETTTITHGSAVEPSNSLVLACWHNAEGHKRPGDHYIEGTEFDMSELVSDIRSSKFLICHNAKFELQWLKRCGLALEETLVYDTKLAEYVLGGNTITGYKNGLNQCLQRHELPLKRDIVGLMFKAGFDTTEIPFSWVLEYCKWDVHVTHLLYQSQMRKLTPELLAVVYARCLLTPVLADIEFNGMAIDVTRVTQMIEEKTRECNELTALFLAEFGTENVNGTIEKQRLLFDELGFGIPTDPRTKRPMLTPTGRPQTNEDAIRRLRPSNARQRRFLELYTKYKQLHSELTKYLNTFAECAASSGILRGEFHQARTRTHRLSSSGLDYSVQFQNLPRAYKSLFVPKRKGWRMGEADGSQLEFRVAAHLGRDDTALEHIVSGVDIHARTASIIGCTRQEAKAHSFKPLYGGSSGTQAERNYYETFKRTYKGIASSQQEWLSHVLTHKQLETEWGLIYYWPDTHRTSSGYITNTTSIYNYPVQALATAEIIPLTLIAMWHTLKRSQYKMEIVNTIHDSIVVELPPEEEEVFHELTREAFTVTPYELLYKLYGVQFSVPLGSESKCGDAWGQGTGRKYQASEDLYTWQI